MRLFPAAKIFTGLLIVAVAVPAFAQTTSSGTSTSSAMSQAQMDQLAAEAQKSAAAQVQAAQSAATQAMGQQIPGLPTVAAQPPSLFNQSKSSDMTEDEYLEQIKDKDSSTYKAAVLAKKAKQSGELVRNAEMHKDENDLGEIYGEVPPPEMETLQNIKKTQGGYDKIADDSVVDKDISFDMRRDAQKEAALSYGARGGLAKRAYEIMESVHGYEGTLDRVFDFRQLLVKAPSGLLIEPPIVHEAVEAIIINPQGDEAAVADQVLKINKQARIVAAPRDWRNYLIMQYARDIPPPPKVLWPRNDQEQADWNTWVKKGWDAGYSQGEDIFETNVNQLLADYNGMVRYRTLLAEGKISQPYAMQEDRGVTGGKDEMRVGDRALRITGPSEFLTGADLWKPADR